MERITWKNLEGLADRINKAKGTPEKPWTVNDKGKSISAIGNYHIDGAYGGVSLHCMVNECGGSMTCSAVGTLPNVICGIVGVHFWKVIEANSSAW